MSMCVATSRAGHTYALDRRTQQGEGELASHPGQRDAVGLVSFLCEHGCEPLVADICCIATRLALIMPE